MSEGVENILKFMEGSKELILDGIAVSKGGVTLSDLPKGLKMLLGIKALYDIAPSAWPEAKDLTGKEAGEVFEAAYQGVKEIVEALKAVEVVKA